MYKTVSSKSRKDVFFYKIEETLPCVLDGRFSSVLENRHVFVSYHMVNFLPFY